MKEPDSYHISNCQIQGKLTLERKNCYNHFDIYEIFYTFLQSSLVGIKTTVNFILLCFTQY